MSKRNRKQRRNKQKAKDNFVVTDEMREQFWAFISRKQGLHVRF